MRVHMWREGMRRRARGLTGRVWKICLEQKVPCPQLLHGMQECRPLEPEARIDLPLEILTGQQIELRMLFVNPTVLELPVHGFEKEGDVANTTLNGDEIQIWKPMTDAAHDESAYGSRVCLKDTHTRVGIHSVQSDICVIRKQR